MRGSIILSISIYLCAAIDVAAQKDIPENLPQFDQKKIHFGFSLGGGLNGFRLDQDLTKSDSLVKLEVIGQPGFNVNVVSELHFGDLVGLRFTPGISFASRVLRYSYFQEDNTRFRSIDRVIESTYIDIPLSLKFRSKRVNNFASYVLVGGKYSIDLASQANADNQVDDQGEFVVKLKQNNYNIETGVGFDFFLEYFKFSTELKFAYGLNSIIVQDNTRFSDPISGLHSRVFIIAVNFEG